MFIITVNQERRKEARKKGRKAKREPGRKEGGRKEVSYLVREERERHFSVPRDETRGGGLAM